MRCLNERLVKTLAATLIFLTGSSSTIHAGGTDFGRHGGHRKPGCRPAGHAADPGFQGFGLSCHLGYGYGGRAFGVGPFGGYPGYGGPGYPCLGAPYDPTATGPLRPNPSVVTSGDGPDVGYIGDYGLFTGAPPYPDTIAP